MKLPFRSIKRRQHSHRAETLAFDALLGKIIGDSQTYIDLLKDHPEDVREHLTVEQLSLVNTTVAAIGRKLPDNPSIEQFAWFIGKVLEMERSLGHIESVIALVKRQKRA